MLNINIKRIAGILTVMTVALAATGLQGCSIGGKNIAISGSLGKNELIKVNSGKISKGEGIVYLINEKSDYEQTYGAEIWDKTIEGDSMEEYIKDNVKDELSKRKVLCIIAGNNGIELSGEEEELVKTYAAKYKEMLNGTTIKGVSDEDIEAAYKDYVLSMKVYNELTKDKGEEISDIDAKVIDVKSIYLKTYTLDSEGNKVYYTTEEIENTKNQMNDILNRLNGGEDFDALAAEFTQADSIEYVFGKGEMVEAFETAAFNLKTGEMSGVVTGDDGFYIIKCISDYMESETVANKERLLKESKEEYFISIYNEFIETASVRFNDEAWDKIELKDYSNVNADFFYEVVDLVNTQQ